MQIVLTRDINPNKGMVRGAMFDWPKMTISEMSKQLGEDGKPDDGWYKLAAQVERSAHRQNDVTENQREQIEAQRQAALEETPSDDDLQDSLEKLPEGLVEA